MRVGQIILAPAGFKHTSYGYLQNHESVRERFRALHSDYPLTPSIKNIFVKKRSKLCVCAKKLYYIIYLILFQKFEELHCFNPPICTGENFAYLKQ